MSSNNFEQLAERIMTHPSNSLFTSKGWKPIFTASKTAKIVIIGQAPGLAAQESEVPWNDVSGRTLRTWLGMSDEVFYDDSVVSLLPMDFYYPGKNPKGGDLPPRKDFAPMWHEQTLAHMPNIKLVLLVGSYAQAYYLGDSAKKNLTENVRNYTDFLPQYFPIVHPSPLAGRWRAQNPWFERDVLPELRTRVASVLE